MSLPRINILDFIKPIAPDFSNKMVLLLDHITPKSGNISFFELVALSTLVHQFKPKTIMEFGTFDGRSTINIALNVPDSIIYTVDLPLENIHKTSLPLVDSRKGYIDDELGYVGADKLFNDSSHLKIVQIWSDTAQLDFRSNLNTIDFLFVDASHSYENCYNDTRIAFEIVKHNGIIVWHDYNGWPGVTKALDQWQSQLDGKMKFYWLHDTSIVVAQNKKENS